MNSIMERWIGSCRRELLDRTLVWNQRHLMTVLREHEAFYNTHRPHRTLKQAAPLRPLPEAVTNLDQFQVQPHTQESTATASRYCRQFPHRPQSGPDDLAVELNPHKAVPGG